MDLVITRDQKRIMALQAIFSALIAGLSALAAGAVADNGLTLATWLIAASTASAAAGSVYGVGTGPSAARPVARLDMTPAEIRRTASTGELPARDDDEVL